jgi:multiple sugar transport system ATP-binding protein
MNHENEDARMGQVILKNVVKHYGKTAAVHGVNLEIHDGEFMVFVGPSGCGKTTLLRLIAGLEEMTEGELYIDGQLANDMPPAKRHLAMVFQSYALYPHMTVYENMAFSLKLAGYKKDAIQAAVQNTADILQIGDMLKRKPRELSGGERQRVAIGRAIVRQPSVFLFDEPLSNLDASLRVQMRIELTRLHQQLKTTMIYVTHDQVEAMTLGERIAVFNMGRIEQVGTPIELYDNPVNLFVAGFLGSPKMNLIQAEVVSASQRKVTVRVAGEVTVVTAANGSSLKPGDFVTLGIRPEHVVCGPSTNETNSALVTANVVEHLGDVSVVYAAMPGVSGMVSFKQPAVSVALKPGSEAVIHFPPDRCYLFDTEGRTVERTTGEAGSPSAFGEIISSA